MSRSFIKLGVWVLLAACVVVLGMLSLEKVRDAADRAH